jgi:hypothetical protein
VQFHGVNGRGLHDPHTQRTIEDTDADVLSWCDPQDVQEVIGARAGKRDASSGISRVSAADLTGLEQNEIHDLVFIT